MTNTDSTNILENVMSAQKQAVDSIVENTKKFTNGNAMVNDTMQKGSEWYKNWLDSQKNVFSETSAKANTAKEATQENASKMNEFYQNWFNTQMNQAKQIWETSQNWAKNNVNPSANMNPMDTMNNWMNQTNNWANNMGQANNWMNQFNQMQNQMQNAFNMDSWKNASENWTGMFNQYYETLNSTFADWQKNFKNGTVQDAYKNMVNVAEGFSRFSEMWAPMWKSIQDKTFNTDMYKQWMNPAQYKDLMDKYFGFMPENTRQYIQNMTEQMNNSMKQMNQMGTNSYQQMRSMMSNFPGMNSSDMFGGMMNAYNTMQNNLNNAFAPLTKMMGTNQHTKAAAEWADIANRAMVYNIKNSELQFMIYTQGTKVMDKLAENIASKIEKGTEITSMMALYQEWLNISDKVYVSLFEGEEYSKLMAEVSAMQLTLRKDMEKQMEKSMSGIPVATRSEMDELYKTIYDLKKQVRQLEKMMEFDGTEEVAEEKTTARKSKKA